MIGFALLAAASAAAIDPGPAPSWDQAVALGNQALKARMIDPESARVVWPYSLFGGSLKGLLGKRQAGWITCGEINSRNSMGGYSGAMPFLIVFRNGAVAELDIGAPDGIDPASATCPSLLKQGLLHASGAPADAAPLASQGPSIEQYAAGVAASAAQQGGLGISFVPSPAGLVLIAVAPGSSAAAAGLKAGQVIERANGIDLKGMPQAAAIAVMKGQPRPISVELAGGLKAQIARR